MNQPRINFKRAPESEITLDQIKAVAPWGVVRDEDGWRLATPSEAVGKNMIRSGYLLWSAIHTALSEPWPTVLCCGHPVPTDPHPELRAFMLCGCSP